MSNVRCNFLALLPVPPLPTYNAHFFTGTPELAQPQEHPAHLPFRLSRRILSIIAATIPSKTKAVKMVPNMLSPFFGATA